MFFLACLLLFICCNKNPATSKKIKDNLTGNDDHMDSLPTDRAEQDLAAFDAFWRPFIEKANSIYKTPYVNAAHEKRTCAKTGLVVHRPNHGIRHGVCQMALGIDLLNMLCELDANALASPQFVQRVRKAKKDVPCFTQLFLLALLYLRSGRKDEGSSSVKEYLPSAKASEKNFKAAVQKANLQGVTSSHVDAFALAMRPHTLLGATARQGLAQDVSILIAAVHKLEFIRMVNYNKPNRTKKFFLDNLSFPASLLAPLITRAKGYLAATGVIIDTTYGVYAEKFFKQAHNTQLLYQAVHQVAQTPVKLPANF